MEERAAKRVQIASMIDRFGKALFRAHVMRCTDNSIVATRIRRVGRHGQTEITEFPPSVCINEDVVRFDVPVQETSLVQPTYQLQHL